MTQQSNQLQELRTQINSILVEIFEQPVIRKQKVDQLIEIFNEREKQLLNKVTDRIKRKWFDEPADDFQEGFNRGLVRANEQIAATEAELKPTKPKGADKDDKFRTNEIWGYSDPEGSE